MRWCIAVLCASFAICAHAAPWEPTSVRPEQIQELRGQFDREFLTPLPEAMKPAPGSEHDCFWAGFLISATYRSAELAQRRMGVMWEGSSLQRVTRDLYCEAKAYHEQHCRGPGSPETKERRAIEYHFKKWGDLGDARKAEVMRAAREGIHSVSGRTLMGAYVVSSIGPAMPPGVQVGPRAAALQLAVIAAAAIDWPFFAAFVAPKLLEATP